MGTRFVLYFFSPRRFSFRVILPMHKLFFQKFLCMRVRVVLFLSSVFWKNQSCPRSFFFFFFPFFCH